jgi:hypothetical protein
VTLCRRQDKKVTIITAYNATLASGDSTFYHQQTRLLSRHFREKNRVGIPNPRQQFILDFQSWVQTLQSKGHEIILTLVANDVYNPDLQASPHNLEYHPGKSTMANKHDGKLATLVTTCNLSLPLAIQHATCLFPASHIRGKNQIDFLLVSISLLPAVTISGVLPHSSVFHSDHQPYFVDFDAQKLFGSPAYDIVQAQVRTLRLRDPRVVSKYLSSLHSQLDSHNMFPRLEALKSVASSLQWTTEHNSQYEELDQTRTESMLSAEKAAGKRITMRFHWLPPLKKAVQALRYWMLWSRHVSKLPVSSIQMEKYKIEGEVEEQLDLMERDILAAHHRVYRHLKALQLKDTQLREEHLEALAEAIVLQKSPQLGVQSMATILEGKVEKQLKQLVFREKTRRMYRKIGRTLDKLQHLCFSLPNSGNEHSLYWASASAYILRSSGAAAAAAAVSAAKARKCSRKWKNDEPKLLMLMQEK